MKWLLLITALSLGTTCCWTLKCQTDDGVTEEDVRRIVRVCMRKVGDDDHNNSDYGGYSESDEYDNEGDDDSTEEQQQQHDRGQRKHNSNGGAGEDNYNYRNQHRNRDRDHLRGSQGFRKPLQYSDYSYSQSGGGGGGGQGGSYGNGNHGGGGGNYPSNNGGRSSSDSGRNVSLTDKQAERDRACIVHCFFQEMKMTNDRQLPDKHKVIQVITKDLRDKQLKEFYINSIQECFYILEFNHQRPGKCEFSNRLLQCLAERARNNCDDWDNRTVIF